MHVAEAKKKLGSRFTWLCDTMANDAKHALGDAPNSEFVIGPDGKFLKVRRWSRPAELREDLAALVGGVEHPTSIADIGMKPLEAPKTAPRGVVARLRLPGAMTPIEVRPSTGLSLPPPAGEPLLDEPLYVKLRAEVDALYFREGQGKLYLGFFLDPLYKVHWNNQVAPIAYEIDAPPGVDITPLEGHGPTVEAKADADPREFLVALAGKSPAPIKLTVKYFACDDAETFCKPVTQHYLITLRPDRDGGSRRGGGRPAGDVPPGNVPPTDLLLGAIDADKDGALSADELAKAPEALLKLDRNRDGRLTPDELPVPPARQRGGPFAGGGAGGIGAPGGGAVRRPNPAELLARMDADGDGKIAKSEVSPQMLQRWDRMDTNGDGFIDKQELQELAARFQRNSGDRGPGNRPDPRGPRDGQRPRRPSVN